MPHTGPGARPDTTGCRIWPDAERVVCFLVLMRSLMMPGTLDFTVVLEPQPDGRSTVSMPALTEAVTEGNTEEKALVRGEEAIRAVLDYRRDQDVAILGHSYQSPLRPVDLAVGA